MSGEKLTDAEARRLIAMLKRALIEAIDFPDRGKKAEFDVVGDTKKDLFTVSIFRGKIQSKKYSIGARIKKNGISLLELHINATNVHLILMEKKSQKTTGMFIRKNMVENLRFLRRISIVKSLKKTQ